VRDRGPTIDSIIDHRTGARRRDSEAMQKLEKTLKIATGAAGQVAP